MQYILLGRISSKQEELAVLDQVQRGLIPARRSVEYAEQITALAFDGFRTNTKGWIRTEEEHVIVFTGRGRGEEPTKRGGRRILAAVEIDGAGKLISLLKIVGDYTGEARDWVNHIDDALDRYRRGKRIR